MKSHTFNCGLNHVEIKEIYDSWGRVDSIIFGNVKARMIYNKKSQISGIVNIVDEKDTFNYSLVYKDKNVTSVKIRYKSNLNFLTAKYAYDKTDSLICEEIVSNDSVMGTYKKKSFYYGNKSYLIKMIYLNDSLEEETIYNNKTVLTQKKLVRYEGGLTDTISSYNTILSVNSSMSFSRSTFSKNKYINLYFFNDSKQLVKIKTIYLGEKPVTDKYDFIYDYTNDLIMKESIVNSEDKSVLKEYKHIYEFW